MMTLQHEHHDVEDKNVLKKHVKIFSWCALLHLQHKSCTVSCASTDEHPPTTRTTTKRARNPTFFCPDPGQCVRDKPMDRVLSSILASEEEEAFSTSITLPRSNDESNKFYQIRSECVPMAPSRKFLNPKTPGKEPAFTPFPRKNEDDEQEVDLHLSRYYATPPCPEVRECLELLGPNIFTVTPRIWRPDEPLDSPSRQGQTQMSRTENTNLWSPEEYDDGEDPLHRTMRCDVSGIFTNNWSEEFKRAQQVVRDDVAPNRLTETSHKPAYMDPEFLSTAFCVTEVNKEKDDQQPDGDVEASKVVKGQEKKGRRARDDERTASSGSTTSSSKELSTSEVQRAPAAAHHVDTTKDVEQKELKCVFTATHLDAHAETWKAKENSQGDDFDSQVADLGENGIAPTAMEQPGRSHSQLGAAAPSCRKVDDCVALLSSGYDLDLPKAKNQSDAAPRMKVAKYLEKKRAAAKKVVDEKEATLSRTSPPPNTTSSTKGNKASTSSVTLAPAEEDDEQELLFTGGSSTSTQKINQISPRTPPPSRVATGGAPNEPDAAFQDEVDYTRNRIAAEMVVLRREVDKHKLEAMLSDKEKNRKTLLDLLEEKVKKKKKRCDEDQIDAATADNLKALLHSEQGKLKMQVEAAGNVVAEKVGGGDSSDSAQLRSSNMIHTLEKTTKANFDKISTDNWNWFWHGGDLVEFETGKVLEKDADSFVSKVDTLLAQWETFHHGDNENDGGEEMKN
ncbi:unnamed protein product [Amoebophrya sp. A120]|nr:unnamed protein product [Amoebophrya sp. A120]|eukprot:GSA120T00009727001.1